MQTIFPQSAGPVEVRHRPLAHSPAHAPTQSLSRLPTSPRWSEAKVAFSLSGFAAPKLPSEGGSPSHSLRNDDGFWELTFASRHAILTQDQGLFYVAFLLANPGQAFQAIELAEKVYEVYGAHPDFREVMPWLESSGHQTQVAKVLQQKQERLEAILDSADEIEPVKAEALRDLAAVYVRQKSTFDEIAASAEKTGNMLLRGLYHLQLSLANGPAYRSQHPDPQNPLRPFAAHLLKHLLIPSIRLSARGGAHFIYQPPEGVAWA